MAAEKTRNLEDLRKELRENYRKVFTSKEMVQFRGGDRYPGPFVFFNREATRDAMVHFVDGIGDTNILYRGPVVYPDARFMALITGISRKDRGAEF
jgi:hypothetical protein